jgi:hypothetical protein
VVKPAAELRLTNNHKLKFHWHAAKRALFVELQRPTTDKNGHGWGFVDGVTLQAEDLAALIQAIGGPPEPELPQAA